MDKLESVIVNNVFHGQAEPRAQFQMGDIAKKYLQKYANIIKDLSSSYVENQKEDIAKKMTELDFVKAYSLYYLPINFFKAKFLFSKIQSEIFKEKTSLKLLDYGCGPATGALAACSFFNEQKISLDITLYDKSSKMRSFGEKLLKDYSKNNVHVVNSASDIKNQKYDVITIFNVINELSDDAKISLAENIGKILNDKGLLIILEPALKDLARNLMDFRDDVLKENMFSILYPCFHTCSCPMKQCNDEWCHGELQGLNSKLVRQIDEITGFNKHKIKYSSVIFYNSKFCTESNDCFRVVNIPKEVNSGVILNLCTKDCIKEVVIKKDMLKKNKKLKKIKFFDVVKGSEFL